jgi:hypothetical protein
MNQLISQVGCRQAPNDNTPNTQLIVAAHVFSAGSRKAPQNEHSKISLMQCHPDTQQLLQKGLLQQKGHTCCSIWPVMLGAQAQHHCMS